MVGLIMVIRSQWTVSEVMKRMAAPWLGGMVCATVLNSGRGAGDLRTVEGLPAGPTERNEERDDIAADPVERDSPMNALKKAAQVALVALVVLVVTVLHYGSGEGAILTHMSHRELYFIPILLASFWFGLKYGLATSLSISLIYAPQIFSHSETPGVF